MKVKPVGDRILAKREETKETMKSGIVIPDTAREKSMEARVIAVGPGKLDDKGKRPPTEVKKDDRILIGRFSGTEVRLDGEEHVILRERDVLAVIENQ